MLASAFAADVALITPEVCAGIRASISVESSPGEREVLRHALVVLARRTVDLSFALAREIRERFDATLGSKAGGLARNVPDEIPLPDEAGSRVEAALDSCAAGLRKQAASEIATLTQRMGELLGDESLEDSRNPVLPRLFASALMEAIAALGFSGDAKVAVFECYGPALLRIAPDLYRHGNTLLGER
jgi:hypothetical protein